MKSKSTAGRHVLGAAAVLIGGLVAWAAMAEDSMATARKVAAKANRLAAKNKCKLAVPAFNRAYRTLKEPTLLFNRAECLRKLGAGHDALRDYQLFLAEMPKAPNRAVVEERIAALLEAAKAELASGGIATAPTPEPTQATAKQPAPGEGPAEASTVTAVEEVPPPAPSVGQAPAPTAKQPAPPAPAAKAPAAPPHRAEKWTD